MNHPKLKLISVFFLLCFSNFAWAQTNEAPELSEARKLNLEAVKLFGQARYDEALPLATRALELRQKALGPNHQDLIPLHTNIAEMYRAKNQPGQARSYFERALTIAEKAYTENSLKTAQLLDKLGYLANDQREHDDAARFFTRSLEIKDKVLSQDDPSTARTVFALAELHRFRGDYQKAEPFYERVVRAYERAPGKDNSDLTRALMGYFTTLHALKKADQAAEIQQRLSRLIVDQGLVQGGVLNGKALKLVQPPYPMIARSEGAQGLVRVLIVIDVDGKVVSAETIDRGNTHPALAAAAERAARQSLFTPTFLSGLPVKVSGVIIYKFIPR